MSNSGGFQVQVYPQPAAAVAGNRASQNPLFTYDAGPGGLVAGSSLFVGRWAWVTPPADPNGTPTIANSFSTDLGAPAGIVGNEQQALQPIYLANAGMQVQPGFPATIIIAGDYWVQNDGTNEATFGMKAYADFVTGKVTFNATGTPGSGASATGSSIAASTFSVTGSILNDVLTVSAVGSGTIVAGATISGTNVVSGTKIVSQMTGTAGGVGTYRVNIAEQTVASTTISGTYGTFTVGTLTTTPVFQVGQQISGSGVTAGTTLTQLLTGTGGSGSTFAVDPTQTAGSTTIAAVTSVETKWFARSTGLPGEPVKISSTPLGSGSN